jgi:peptidoglycan hydrolase CwlO-like protein
MGYLATEIIILLAGAAVLGLVIGWALFGLGKKPAVAVAGGVSPRADADLKQERDARKKAETRIVELQSKETGFNERLQERDAKVAELSHQLDDLSKYRVETAAALEKRDQRIAGLESQLLKRDAELQRVAGGLPPSGDLDDKLGDRDRQIAKLKAELESAQASASPDAQRLRDLERENRELRQTLIATDGAAPTTASEKDGIIARLNEEVTGLRAAYESAEQALEEQDGAIDKLTRDLQATQYKLAQATGEPSGKPQSAELQVSMVKPSMAAAKPVVAKPAPEPAAPAPPSEPDESTMAVSLEDLVSQIDQKSTAPPADKMPEPPPPPPPEPAREKKGAKAEAAPPAKAAEAAPEAEESTMAVSLEDLVSQIDQKSSAPPADK